MTPRPLIVRLCNWVGDVILTVPSLRLLQAHGYELQLVGKGWARPLLAGEAWPTHARVDGLRANGALLRQLRRAAREADPGFDRRPNALVLPNSFSSALEMRLAGLKATGYAHEGRSPLLGRSLPPPAYEEHVLMRYWKLSCSFLGIQAPAPESIDLHTAPADQQAADALLAAHGIRPGFIVICPMAGGTYEKLDKKWPAFADFTRALLPLGRQVVACPGPGEESIITDHHAGVTMLPGVKLGVYGALLRRSALVVSNDTGPAHLAAAVGAPLLSVLGPTKPEQWAPWGPTVHVLRRWPEWPTVDEVLAQVRNHARA
ncbi:glycosyltransferase family 9 protein [Ideonella sp. A 288]|uniref:glycosyltransferase family 9 protein n=1 Tax=Ideonella sp. A 288 TaxID=1962181 RepID=UPI00130328A7|nr:glycosyltransferase family 9 protein [Ideonella sp. A 288]